MVSDRYPVTPPAEGTYARSALRNNAKGTDLGREALERFKIREICEGWAATGMLRSAFPILWQNYLAIFFDAAYVATSWKQGTIDEFIEASKAGFAAGLSFMDILHWTCGSPVEVDPTLTRAVCKMKTTITCRFTFSGVEMDNEADCRVFFLLKKRAGRWGVCFYTLLFDKDKFVPVHPAKLRPSRFPRRRSSGSPRDTGISLGRRRELGILPS
ncbi:hypothetical protein BO82DRAFT_360724 [Aspergillus uvarum CBS 121591]|uniref:SnoaL-like domain-containing protein n=1 Tax=Aspergillus uvarum CBS 121591 TaxID=1448315 RepID=A0A319CQI4_9EURO|nr:hypothetical protein BO82DRAFT_360724 [Aspergillus uvarum CBS 121591]PYH86411.1 hypothetical protein BO82DRAFT_360724 [Aspergillus uvarum CBS 121591]